MDACYQVIRLKTEMYKLITRLIVNKLVYNDTFSVPLLPRKGETKTKNINSFKFNIQIGRSDTKFLIAFLADHRVLQFFLSFLGFCSKLCLCH